MKGRELAEDYFFQAGLPLLEKAYPELTLRVAAGLVAGGFASGSGSEVGGFDDDISRDHNWGPRFFLFLAPEDMATHGGALQAYLDESLPAEFGGFTSTATTLPKNRAYIVTPQENLRAVLGVDEVPASDLDWLDLPEPLLFEYTAGPIFYEPSPLVTPLRQQFAYYPDQVWYKRLSFAFFQLHAPGNARRMAERGDVVAASLYVSWFLECAMRLAHLLRRRYAPYRKWLFQSFRALPDLSSGLVEQVTSLATGISLDTVQGQMREIQDALGVMANGSGLIEPLPLHATSPFVWTDFNCYGFMEAFEQKLIPPLRGAPHDGPLDMWVAAHLPLKTEMARKLRS